MIENTVIKVIGAHANGRVRRARVEARLPLDKMNMQRLRRRRRDAGDLKRLGLGQDLIQQLETLLGREQPQPIHLFA